MKKIITLVSCLVCLTAIRAQSVSVSDAIGQSPETFVRNHLMGNGCYVFNVRYNNASSVITSPSIGTFNANGYNGLGMQTGVIMTTGNIDVAPGPQVGTADHAIEGYYHDPEMEPYASDNVYGCSTLDFDFICLTDTFTFNYCFASNEYPYMVCSRYNDCFGLFLTGPDPRTGIEVTKNLAIIPGTVSDSLPDGIPVSTNTINNGSAGMMAGMYGLGTDCHYEFTSLFVDNLIMIIDSVNWTATMDTSVASMRALGFRGFTAKLSANGSVLPCQIYHMHISICNVHDNSLDSGVMIEGGSFDSPSAQIGLSRPTIDTIPGRCGLEVPLSLSQADAFDQGTVHFAFGGDAILGTDFELVDEWGNALDSTGLGIDNGTHSFVVRALPGADLGAPKSVELYLQTSLCPQYPELVTHDTMRFVLTKGTGVEVGDTTISCSHACFEVSAPLLAGEEPINYRWEPATGIADPYSRTSSAAIFESADYLLIATGGSGCNSDTATVHILITGEDPLGIDGSGVQSSEVRVYPNPAGDVIHVDAADLKGVELYSLDGRRLGMYTATGATLDIPTEGLANGTYGLRIVTATGSTGMKIVVNK